MTALALWWFGMRIRGVAFRYWARTGFGWPDALETTKRNALRALAECQVGHDGAGGGK